VLTSLIFWVTALAMTSSEILFSELARTYSIKT
jgi:hypothetical protein